jgi:pSer/pThr/pTyr-binding forkhead associated (FHA) protein
LLKKTTGEITGESFDVMERAIIGRADLSAVHVDIDLATSPEARLVSAQHAEIRYQSDVGWIIRDLGSRNGTFLRHKNEASFHRVAGEEVLKDGDEVSFGNAKYEFHI